jgi:hypothetical protein
MHIHNSTNLFCDPIFEQDNYNDDNGSGEDFEEFADDCEEFTGGNNFLIFLRDIILDLTKIFTSATHTNYRVITLISKFYYLFYSLIVKYIILIPQQLSVLNHYGVGKLLSMHI